MWIRFWVQSRCASGLNSTEDSYEWFDKRPSDKSLEAYAEDYASNTYYWTLERGCKYGYERLRRLPAKAKQELIDKYKRQVKYARSMLKLLEK